MHTIQDILQIVKFSYFTYKISGDSNTPSFLVSHANHALLGIAYHLCVKVLIVVKLAAMVEFTHQRRIRIRRIRRRRRNQRHQAKEDRGLLLLCMYSLFNVLMHALNIVNFRRPTTCKL